MSTKRDRSHDTESDIIENEQASTKKPKLESTSKTENEKKIAKTKPIGSDNDQHVSKMGASSGSVNADQKLVYTRDRESTTESSSTKRKPLKYKKLETGRNRLVSYVYITDIDDFELAMTDIRTAVDSKTMIAIDCEGVELSRFGSLTILSIGTEEVVFLIDVLKIGNAVFDKGLRNFLEDADIEKLMFDCREDADALLHKHSVTLDGVLDIQLLDVKDRIQSYGYTKIRSLKHCLELYTTNDPTLLNIKVTGRSNMDNKGEVWGRRPLDENLLEYAVVDVVALFTLYNKLEMRMQHQRWKEASKRYCDYDRNRRRVFRDGSNRLPSGII